MVSFNSACSQNAGNSKKDRLPAVAGQFYPADSSTLRKNVTDLFSRAVVPKIDNVVAVIVPHAGYVYSGQVAASAFNQIDKDKSYKTIFIIGTSHKMTFDGAAIYNSGDFITPLGKVSVDTDLSTELIKRHNCFIVKDEAHLYEHCLEVQLPFLQVHLKKPFKIVPIIIATSSINTIKKISDALKDFLTSENLFVISTDFSHYPSYKDACSVDSTTAKSIISNNAETFLSEIQKYDNYKIPNLSTKICGWSSVLALLNITDNNPNFVYHTVQYMNSGDVSGDKSSVVGYWAIAISSNKSKNEKNSLFSEEDKKMLLKIARNTLESYIINKRFPDINTDNFSEKLFEKYGVFVTLHKNGELRGCIGRFSAQGPVYETVRDMTISAATQDPRFLPVTKDEIKDIDIEISVLTPLKKITSPDEIELGKHGIYMSLNGMSGTFLPQVAKETGWDKEEFLGHCARDKAGIGWNGWKKADLYTYEAIVFGEKDFK